MVKFFKDVGKGFKKGFGKVLDVPILGDVIGLSPLAGLITGKGLFGFLGGGNFLGLPGNFCTVLCTLCLLCCCCLSCSSSLGALGNLT